MMLLRTEDPHFTMLLPALFGMMFVSRRSSAACDPPVRIAGCANENGLSGGRISESQEIDAAGPMRGEPHA
jgi:hypothetical protein